MTTQSNEAGQWSARAVRTLGALERMLKRHAHELMALDCEDAEPAEAILFAVRAVDQALDNTRAVRRSIQEQSETCERESGKDQA